MRISRQARGFIKSTAAAVMVCMITLSGCTIDGGEKARQEAEQQRIADEIAHEKPVVNIEDAATDVSPLDPVTVRVDKTALTSVEMTNEDGKVVESTMAPDHKSWSSSEPLGYSRTYTITAEADNGQSVTSSFTTLTPNVKADVYMSPLKNSVVGVGQPIAFRFDTPIYDRHAAQNAIKVTTDPPVEGAFYWLSNVEVRWRPAEFWKPGTTVKVEANIYGKDFGNGTYGHNDNATNFTIGDAIISTVDDSTKTMTVTKNGDVVKTMPVSLGSPKHPTPNGTYIIGDRRPSIVMDSSTFGVPVESPEGYKTDVQWATQMSWSGIYVHSAPWSLWAQGSQDVSHGCVNVSPANAQWFQQFSQRGDVVKVVNTQGGILSGYDGLGDWNIPWETWKAGNADDGPAY